MHNAARFREELSAHIDKSGGTDACWLWTGKRGTGGYGVLKCGRLAHRVALEVLGAELHDFPVCHHCDNRACVNPAHLYIGTAKSNTRDAMERGRLPIPDKRYHKSLKGIERRHARQQAWEDAHRIEPDDLSGISIG